MSKQNNLTDFLTDVADALRSKKGTTDLINPQNFSAEILALSGGLEVIEMTETTATIEPNKVYVWGMVESLDITLGASTGEDDFFAFRFRCSKPTMTSVTVNGATWAEDTELDAQGKPILDLGSWYQCEIKGGTSALYARLAHYIPFEDSNVEAVLMSKGIGDGIGITYADAAKVTTISTWFKSNAEITSFDELKYFMGVTALEKSAFYGCSLLSKIDLRRIKTFGRYCFENTAIDGDLALPSAEGDIGYRAFAGTLISSVSDLGKIESICKYTNYVSGNYGAFYNCQNLKNVILPQTLKVIGYNAFNRCSNLETINFVETIESIQNNAFSDCSKLQIEKLSLPNLTTLGIGAFAFCYLLRSVENLGSITAINANNSSNSSKTFAFCKGLKKVKIPSTVTTLGTSDSPFNGCNALEEVIIYAETPPSCGINSIFPTNSLKAIYVPDGCVTAYQEATVWANYASYIKPLSEFVES